MNYSVCVKCNKVIVIRNYSSTWKIPENRKKEKHIHKPAKILFNFWFDARKFNKEVLEEYWKVHDTIPGGIDYEPCLKLAIANVLERWQPKLSKVKK